MKKFSRFIFMIIIVFLLLNSPVEAFASEIDGNNFDSAKFFSIQEKGINSIAGTNGELIVNKQKSTPSLYDCEIGMVVTGDGLAIECATYCTVYAEEIGCRDIVLHEKTLFGWKDIAIKDRSVFNSDFYAGGVVYLDAIQGKTYRVSCTHYAIIDGVEHTLYNITDEMVYN